MMIDAHQHYWNPARGDYFWMPPDHPILAKPYRPRDLEPILNRHGIERTVLVQAADTVTETEYMLGIADVTDSVAGVVGWVDFETPEDRKHLERLAKPPKFRGVPPLIPVPRPRDLRHARSNDLGAMRRALTGDWLAKNRVCPASAYRRPFVWQTV